MTEQEVKDKLFDTKTNVFGVKRYRKKPVEISAMKWTGFNTNEMKAFTGIKEIYKDEPFTIPTLEGKHTCIISDYVIQGVVGEFYPCKPEIFKATYEQV